MGRALKILLIVLAAGVAVTPLPRALVERAYSRGLYPVVQPRLTALSNSTPFAWFDAALLAIAVAIFVLWVGRLAGARRGRMLRTLAGLVLDTTVIAALVYIWFLATWGLNYQREPLRVQLDFSEDRISREALRTLALRNVELLNGLHAEAHRRGWPELHSVSSLLEPGFARAQADLGMAWRTVSARPKHSLMDLYFRRTSIDGMTDPFFLETLANQSLLPFERPFTVAHEWSHLAGYADESEANFVAWLICMRGDSATQYSARISLYGTVVNALSRSDRELVGRQLGAGPREDLRAMDERIRQQTLPMARRASNAVYDRFLKANRVEAGIRSYAEVLRLLLGVRFNEDGAPVLRQ